MLDPTLPPRPLVVLERRFYARPSGSGILPDLELNL